MSRYELTTRVETKNPETLKLVGGTGLLNMLSDTINRMSGNSYVYSDSPFSLLDENKDFDKNDKIVQSFFNKINNVEKVFASSNGKQILSDTYGTLLNIRLSDLRLQMRKAYNYIQNALDISNDEAAIFGFDVALAKVNDDVMATWLAASTASAPKPNQVRWALLSDPTKISKLTTENFGTPGEFLTTDGRTIIFNCQERLCALDTSKKELGQSAIRLVSSTQGSEPTQSAWVTVNKVKYLLATVNGKLALLKP